MVTTLPGFSDPVHEAQRTFKGLLDALAHPGQQYSPLSVITAPPGLTPLCAAACLTLLDLETTVWLQPTLPAAVKDWLGFHTGCQFTEQPRAAAFAIINNVFNNVSSNVLSQPTLDAFNWGSAEDPEQSTTLLIQLEDFTSGPPQQLSGPGILESIAIAPKLPEHFWNQWTSNHQAYPQGIDCFLFSQTALMGLPRTCNVS